MTNLNVLKSNLTDKQQNILDAIWEKHLETNKWAFCRIIHHKFKQTVTEASLKKLWSGIVSKLYDSNASKHYYQLSLLGVLLTSEGEQYEQLLVRFLTYLKNRFIENPDYDHVSSVEVKNTLKLTDRQSNILSKLINIGHFWGNVGSNLGNENWDAGVPEDIDLFQEIDLHQYVRNKALNSYKPKLPVDRMEKIFKMNIKNKEEIKLDIKKDYWPEIAKEFDISKRKFGRKINFIKNEFTRKIIFRDIEQAYFLAKYGFNKPAVILAGSVIEELLRLYLIFKKVSPKTKSFDGYIKACEDNGLLKLPISKLSDSVRHFRNLVHLDKEESERYSISKSTAIGTVSSIFTLVNDFKNE